MDNIKKYNYIIFFVGLFLAGCDYNVMNKSYRATSYDVQINPQIDYDDTEYIEFIKDENEDKNIRRTTTVIIEIFDDSTTKWNETEIRLQEYLNVIEKSNFFWESWWDLQGVFYGSDIKIENADLLIGYSKLSHTTGFYDLNSIVEYLQQFYTNRWLDAFLFSENPPFKEYNGILYIHTARAGFPTVRMFDYPVLIKSEGESSLVRISGLFTTWHMFPNSLDHLYTNRSDFLKSIEAQIRSNQSHVPYDVFVRDVISEVDFYIFFINGKIEYVYLWGKRIHLDWKFFS